MYSPEDIDDILNNGKEDEVLEFKRAENNFSATDRSDYCAAIANMGGGKLLLGVANDHSVVGTNVYVSTLHEIANDVYNDIGVNVRLGEVNHPNGRVVVFDIPSRPVGGRVKSNGRYTYPVRRGESLGEMDDDLTRQILNEVQPDFSSHTTDGVTLDDLDPSAVDEFRRLRTEKTGNDDLNELPLERILSDTELMVDGRLTFAAIVLLAKEEVMQVKAPQAEIIYEWRADSGQIQHDFRQQWRAPYFAVYNDIWETINARNARFPYQEGFVQQEVRAFDETAIREAINNAVAHRDYGIQNRSIIIHASPDSLSVTSPGGFPGNITPENILQAQPSWRNRLIAETFEKTGLVERSGQGIDNIFDTTIRQGKGVPNFEGTNESTVRINIPAVVKDSEFVKFLEKVANEEQTTFSFDEVYELEKLREGVKKTDLKHKEKFLQLGVIEKVGRTSGTKYILSHKYYSYKDKPGNYTRVKGFDRETKKQLILEHIRREGRGIKAEFRDVFPDLTVSDLSNLLQELKRENKIKRVGPPHHGRWELNKNETSKY
jgi:ATP-dependent DNA helicase RecG